MEKLLISIFNLVQEFGYIVVPIKDLNKDIKNELGLKYIEYGDVKEVIIASRESVDEAAKIANKLNTIATTAVAHTYGSVVIYLTKSDKSL
jgi:hypothetical protein